RRAYVCPGKMCMDLFAMPGSKEGGGFGDLRLKIALPRPDDRYVPSADRLLRSVAQCIATRAIGVVLTGMGDDGVAGAKAIRGAGGIVIAESEETAVVYGMPGAATRAGIVNESLSLPQIGEYLAQLT